MDAEQPLIFSDYLFLNNYNENIYINDTSRTKDFSADSLSDEVVPTLTTRLQVFNNIADSIQVIYPDNFRAIHPPLHYKAGSHESSRVVPAYGAEARQYTHSFSGLSNTQFSDTGNTADYSHTRLTDVDSYLPENCIIIRKHVYLPANFYRDIAANFDAEEFVAHMSEYMESKRNKENRKIEFYKIIWQLSKKNYGNIGSIVDLIAGNRSQILHLVHEYRIEREEIFTSGKYKGVYFEPANLVITTNTRTVFDHPFSTRELLVQRRKRLINNFKGVHFTLEIVDNSGTYESRFMALGKEFTEDQKETPRVLEITPVEDPLRADGVYYTLVTDKNGRLFKEEKVLSLADAEIYFNLFNTKEKARTHGNIEGAIEAQVQTLKAENRIKEEELTRLKLQLKETEHELESKKLERNDYFDTKKNHRDDYYEERSHVRKDNSELVKYLPALLVGVFGIILTLSKVKGK